jgi:hypothetical protein
VVRVVTLSLGFAPARLVDLSLTAYRKTRNPDLPYEHVLLDQHYPVDKEANRQAVRQLCDLYDVEVLDAGRNLGLHEGFNWALRQLRLQPQDIVIAYDLDSLPLTPGWDMALVRAIAGDETGKIVWASLLNPRSEADLRARGFDRRQIDGYLELWVTKTAVTNSICAWRYGWLQSVGFLQEPRAFYGHLEAAMFSRLGDRQWAFLPGWTESDELRNQHDRAYVVYKWCHSHLNSWPGDFESWLAAGSPNPEDAPDRLP